MLNEAHATARQRDLVLRDLLARARHEGCGGRAAKAELLTGVEGVSSRPVRRIVLMVGERIGHRIPREGSQGRNVPEPRVQLRLLRFEVGTRPEL